MKLWKLLGIALLVTSLALIACGGDDDDDDDATSEESAVNVCESLDELDEAVASIGDLNSESPDSDLLDTRQAIQDAARDVEQAAPESAEDEVLDLVESVEALALVADQLDISDPGPQGLAGLTEAAVAVTDASDDVRSASDCS